MPEAEFILRKSKRRLVGYSFCVGALAIISLKIYFETPSIFTLILGIIFLVAFGYSLHEVIKRKPEIILSSEGIHLREGGFFTWDMIDSFSTVDEGEESSKIMLVFHFSDFADKKIYMESLEVDKDELVSLILHYKGNASLFYSGHTIKYRNLPSK